MICEQIHGFICFMPVCFCMGSLFVMTGGAWNCINVSLVILNLLYISLDLIVYIRWLRHKFSLISSQLWHPMQIIQRLFWIYHCVISLMSCWRSRANQLLVWMIDRVRVWVVALFCIFHQDLCFLVRLISILSIDTNIIGSV